MILYYCIAIQSEKKRKEKKKKNEVKKYLFNDNNTQMLV